MNALLNYFLEANLALLVVAAADYLLLHRETDVTLRRKVLLSGLALSLAIPLLHLPWQQLNETLPSLAYSLPANLPGADSIDHNSTPAAVTTFEWIVVAYGTVSIALLLYTCYQIGRLLALQRRLRYRIVNGLKVYELPATEAAFSFFHHAFVPAGPARHVSHMIAHEQSHARLGHSYDVLALEIIKAIFWINPAVYALKQRFMSVHEFEADRKALQQINAADYETTLVAEALQGIQYPLVNHFNQHLILNRLTMMNQLSKQIARWKLGALALIAVAATVFLACQDQIMKEMDGSTVSQVADHPPQVRADLQRLQKQYPEATFVYVEGEANEVRQLFVQRQSETNLIMNSYDFPDRGTVGVLTVDISKYDLKDADGVYRIVEEAAQPKIGFEKYMAQLAAIIQYPEEARKRNIEGKVFVEFVVNESGSLSDFRLIKGIGGGCDEEALRVFQAGSEWQSGRQRGQPVKQKMVLPIQFRLDGKHNASISFEPVREREQREMKISLEVQNEGINYVLTGTVRDKNGKDIPGMNIVLEGTTNGTVTNEDGRFRLQTKQPNGQLVFSFVGFRTEKVGFGKN